MENAKDEEVSKIESKLIKQALNYRKSKEITQKEIVEATGLSQELVSQMEQIGHIKSLESFIKYVDTLGLKIKLEEKEGE